MLRKSAVSKISKLLASVFGISILMSSFASPLAGRVAAITAVPTNGQLTFTFDDSLDSAITLAAPALAASGFSGVNYVITGCVGMTTVPNTCKADSAKKYMTWAQIAQLKNTYGWEIGSHTDTHPLLASTDPTDQPVALTPTQVVTELMSSRDKLKAQGYTATDFASPYGDYQPDGHPVLASVAKYYASHRGFADQGYNTFPFNDYLLVDQEVLSTMSVAAVQALITTAKTNKQWLILTFHEIVASGAAASADEYDYNSADLAAIAAFAKTSGISVTNIASGLATNNGNLIPNGSFDTAISANTADKTVWSTDDAVNIKQDTASNGSYTPATTAPLGLTNSVSFVSTTAVNGTHLYSPSVPVAAKPYVVKAFVNLVTANATKGEVAFYVEEYNAAGALVGTQYKKTWSVFASANPLVREQSFEYTPSATVTNARIQIVFPSGSAETGYLDNVQMFAEDGSTTGSVVVSGKAGDVNGDSLINALDLSILLSNWNKTAATRATGDLSGDTVVNALDLSILLTNWGK